MVEAGAYGAISKQNEIMGVDPPSVPNCIGTLPSNDLPVGVRVMHAKHFVSFEQKMSIDKRHLSLTTAERRVVNHVAKTIPENIH